MSTEHEDKDNAVPPAPSAPPVPPAADTPEPEPEPEAPNAPEPPRAAPEAAPAAHAAPEAATNAAGVPQPPSAMGPAATGPNAAGAVWPPAPPTLPAYAHSGVGGAGGGGGGHEWGASYHPPQPSGPGRGRGGLVAAVLAAALIAGGVGGGIGYWAAERTDSSTSTSTTVSASQTPADLKREPGSVADIVAKALPSVVTIDAQGGGGAGEAEGGTGTGFVYDKEGHILTNNHVVASAADGGRVSVTFSDGKKYDAEVVGRAQGYDVAVLKLKNGRGDLAPLPLGDSDKVAVGDDSIAIGAPFGLSNTVTTGIVSAKNRPVSSSDGTGTSKNSYMSALQTDASINPGNSGGPLLDSRGAVIGVNSAIQSTRGGIGGGPAGSIGLGFAIPINQAKNVAQQLIKTGKAVYPMIGASVSTQENARDGARIPERGVDNSDPILNGGPADKAGLEPGDLITKLGDRPIDSGPTLISEIWTYQPGDEVELTYERDGKERTVELVLESKDES
ncbi:S1C family serine protease [Streptomyces apocyni]|uniref:S1C family serine protease n=1 Tax=Streptomyces apocyni TaxID=2654677 RepID=UPI0012EA805D|nr:trypsin-like peptidase domain-containing protein [Streptomyces apocyni]